LFELLPHFEVPPRESVSSRFPQVISALCRLGVITFSESRPPFGGVPYADARTVSPTHWIVTGLFGVTVVFVVLVVAARAGGGFVSPPTTA